MMESETERFRTTRSGRLGLLPHIGSMRDVYLFCNTKRITKFAGTSSRFLRARRKDRRGAQTDAERSRCGGTIRWPWAAQSPQTRMRQQRRRVRPFSLGNFRLQLHGEWIERASSTPIDRMDRARSALKVASDRTAIERDANRRTTKPRPRRCLINYFTERSVQRASMYLAWLARGTQLP